MADWSSGRRPVSWGQYELRRRLAALAAGVCLVAGLCTAAGPEPAKVTAVRFWSLGDLTRVAVEVSGEFTFRSEHLSAPERLFFDIRGAKPEAVKKGIQVISVGDALLTQIRVAETQPDVTRVVLDLAQAASFSTSQLSNPSRLMIELRAQDRLLQPGAPSLTGGKELVTRPMPHDTVPVVAAPSVTIVAKTVSAPAMPVSPQPVITPPTETPSAKDGPSVKDKAHVAIAARRADRSLTRALGLKLGRVVLDAGHGGNDVGTHGPSGYVEKDLTLDVARRLGALIEERMGSEVVYTRSDDTYVGLEDRTRLANEREADLFLSIHANSSPYRSAAGVETYILNFTTSKTALETAARENAASQHSIHELHELLEKIALKDKVEESTQFAMKLQSSLSAISTRSNDAAKNRGVKKAPFVVLIGATMPSVLAEIGFLTNATDEALLRKPEHRQKIAEALYKGIESYTETLSRVTAASKN